MIVASLVLVCMMASELRCVKWTWTGDVYNRTVTCIEWAKPPAKDKQTKKNV